MTAATDKAATTEVAIVQADAEGTIRLWSTGAEVLLGYAANEAVGRKIDLIVPEAFHDDHWRGFHGAMARGALNGNEPFALPIKCRSGEVKHFAGRLMLLRDAYGASVGALAVFVAERPAPGTPELYRL